MTDKVTCEIFLVVDEGGDYAVAPDQGEAEEAYCEQISGSGPLRIVKITVKVTPPQVAETEIDIPDEAGEIKQVKTEAA